MTITTKQREYWEKNRRAELNTLNDEISELECKLENLISERDRVESGSIEDGEFEYLFERWRGE